ncbi:TIGR04086 family membrane protein [Bartonella sp. CB175]|uniref:TIGR04086 family membrane protein n=1 Tax=Bartonella sp. CB175 TaxID=3112256 RepID=UPI00300E0919
METRSPEETFDAHFLKETSIETESPLFYTPISWSAIFAGLITALTISVCLSFLVAALGLGQIDFSSSSLIKGSFLSVGIGSLIVMLFSLASGSFIAGRFAESSGALHGFLTWALLTLLMVFQAAVLASSVANLSSKAVLEAGTPAVQQTMSNLKTDSLPVFSKFNNQNFEDFLHEKSSNRVDFDKLRGDLHAILNKNEIPALDIDRLKQVYKAALNDINATITAFKKEPSHYRAHLKDLSNRLSDHAQAVTAKIDENDVINVLVDNGMTRSEAKETADHAIDIYQTAKEKTEDAIEALEEQTNTLLEKLDTLTKDVRHTADQAAKTASHIGWWGFWGSLIGIIISSIFGHYGYRSGRRESLRT